MRSPAFISFRKLNVEVFCIHVPNFPSNFLPIFWDFYCPGGANPHTSHGLSTLQLYSHKLLLEEFFCFEAISYCRIVSYITNLALFLESAT